MKTSKIILITLKFKNILPSRSIVRLAIVLTIFSLLGISCSDLDDEDFFEIQDFVVENTNTTQGFESWDKMFEKLWHDQTILVPAGSSIQEALDAAQPGDAILIEPGIYNEEINIDREDIKLIGMPDILGKTVELSHGITSNIDHAQIINIKPPHEGNFAFQSLNELKNGNGLNSSLRLARETLPEGIVHYTFLVRVGGRKEDVIRLHRVVREERPGKPAPTEGAVFMVHGSSQGFEDIFLYPGIEVATSLNSSPVFLANQNLDVWGIDLAWTRLPASTENFSIMQNWGIDRDVQHTLYGMGVARVIRLLTGQGFGRLNILGFSYGGLVAYVAAGKETQQHKAKRDINGIIPVDFGLKFAPDEMLIRVASCNRAEGLLEQFNQGVFHNNNGQIFSTVGMLALNAPESLSPIIPNLTNYQTALFLGTNSYLQPNPNSEFWHFTAGDINQPTDIANALLYTTTDQWFQLATDLPFYMPSRPVYEYNVCACGEEEVAIDDYLDQISVPILYLGAAGGTGQAGEYTTSLTASTDITHHTVMLEAEDKKFRDFGHADLFIGNNAADLVWNRLSQWLKDHE